MLRHRRCTLTFEGVDSFLYVWLNGQFVGMSKDSRLPAEFDVSSALVSGDNLLAAQVGCSSRTGQANAAP